MNCLKDSYVGQLRSVIGSQMLLLPGARIVIEDSEQRILLQFRSDFKMWGLPGGNAEPGESLEQVVKREVYEETGLNLNQVQAFGFGNDPKLETFTFPNGDKCQFFVLIFFSSSFDGALNCDNEESLQLRWFETDNLPTMLPNMYETLMSFLKFKHTNEFQLI